MWPIRIKVSSASPLSVHFLVASAISFRASWGTWAPNLENIVLHTYTFYSNSHSHIQLPFLKTFNFESAGIILSVHKLFIVTVHTAEVHSWANKLSVNYKKQMYKYTYCMLFFEILCTFLLGSTSSGHDEIQTHSASPSSVNSQTRPAPQCFLAHGSAEYQTEEISITTHLNTSLNLFNMWLKNNTAGFNERNKCFN
jgi:hypothetical protein